MNIRIDVKIELSGEWPHGYIITEKCLKNHIKSLIINDLADLGFEKDQYIVMC